LRFAVSSDGKNWQDFAFAGPVLTGVTLFKQKFLAVGAQGVVLTSADCEIWDFIREENVDQKDWAWVQAENEILVAGDSDGTLYHSKDSGATWQVGNGGTKIQKAPKRTEVSFGGGQARIDQGKIIVSKLGRSVTLPLEGQFVSLFVGQVEQNLGTAATPSPTPVVTASPRPTANPSPSPTAVPTATPSPTPTPTPSPTPTATPTLSPSPTPTATPTLSPSPTPTATPSPRPTRTPSPTPTPVPTVPADAPDFASVRALFNSSCASCHGAGSLHPIFFSGDAKTIAALKALREDAFCYIKDKEMPPPIIAPALSTATQSALLNWIRNGKELPAGFVPDCF
jgi:mono/diheme cytochrome c family protein